MGRLTVIDPFYPVVPDSSWVARLVPAGTKFVQLRIKDQPDAELRRQTIGAGHGFDNDRSSIASIAAVGPAAWNVFLAPKAATPIAAVAAFHIDADSIDKHFLESNLQSCYFACFILSLSYKRNWPGHHRVNR